MIPAANLTAWGQKVPWSEIRQVEQDLIISRAIVAIRFCIWSGSSLSFLSSMVLFTGVGTAPGQTAPCKGRNVRGGASRLPQGQPL